MDLYQAISYPLYAGGILEIILGMALLKQSPRPSRAMRAGAFLYFSAAAFVLCTAVSYTLASRGLDYRIFNKATWIGWFMVPACLQFIYYLQDEDSRPARFVGWIAYPFWTAVYGLTLFTDLVEPGDPSLIPYAGIDGPLEQPLRTLGSLMALWLLVELFRSRARMTGIKRKQLSYFLYGTMFFTGGCILLAGVQPIFGAVDPALSSFFSLPWVVLTYIAITRHRLFDLRLMISRVLNIGLLSFFFSLIHIALFQALAPMLGESLAILISLSFIGMILFGTQLNAALQRWTQQLVVQNKYDYQNVLRESIRAVITILDQDRLLDHIAAGMRRSLGVENVQLALRQRNDTTPPRGGGNRPAELLPFDQDVAAWLHRAGRTEIREELDRTDRDGMSGRVYDYLARHNAEVIIPLRYQGEVAGYLLLGPKGNREPYVPTDLELLEMLAGQMAIALENARLFDEVRRARANYQESEQKFRTLAETAAMVIFIHQGGNFLYANRAAELIGGYTLAEYLNLDFMSLVHPDFADLVQARARDRLAGRNDVQAQYEFKIRRKDGEERWVLMTAGIGDIDGRPSVMGTLIDITARKQAEEQREQYYRELQAATRSLQESEAKFRTLAETTTAGIVIYREGRLIYVNPACEAVTGRDRAELLSMDFWDVIHPEHRDLVRRRGEARLRGEDVPGNYEYAVTTKSGEQRWVSMTAGVIEYERKPAVIATLFDITDRMLAEAETVRLFEQRIAVEKRHVLEKEKILMDLHDGIGGITTNISILSELGQKATDLDSVKQTLRIISRLSREGIGEIRSFMHSLDSRELNWRTLAAELRNQGTNMLEPVGIAFELTNAIDELQEQPGSLLWVNLFKIYKESLTNIIKHARATSVQVAFRCRPDAVDLVIADNGVGCNGREGGGRGLSNMLQRAAELGGTVAVTAGRGTTVKVTIPLPLKYPEQGMEL